jgi:hypothetical protein
VVSEPAVDNGLKKSLSYSPPSMPASIHRARGWFFEIVGFSPDVRAGRWSCARSAMPDLARGRA